MSGTRPDDVVPLKQTQSLAEGIKTSQALQDGFEAYFGNDDESKAKKLTLEAFSKQYPTPPYALKKLGDGNNFNIRITNTETNESIVVQMGNYFTAIEVAMQQLASGGQPKWLATSHFHTHESAGYVGIDSFNKTPDHSVNKFPTEIVGYLTVMEYCPDSLDSRIQRLHDPANTVDPSQRITEAQNLGKQVAEMLSDMSKRDILWTDMKAGNILFRANGDLVVADTKAFYPVDMIPLTAKPTGTVVRYPDITAAFLSTHFHEKKLEGTITRHDAKMAFEGEHSYQLACMLYKVLTNVEVINDGKQKSNALFKWDHANLNNSEEAKQVKYLIQQLSQDDPSDRMHYAQAAELLSVIGKKNEHGQDLFELKVLEYEEKKTAKKEAGELETSETVESTAASKAEEQARAVEKAKFTSIMREINVEQLQHIYSKQIKNAIKKIDATNPSAQDKKEWEDKYSQKLAALLYTSCTRGYPVGESEINVKNVVFDFNHPIFQGERGGRLRSVIERLNNTDPDMRMRPADAATLIAVIDNKDEYERKNTIINNIIAHQKDTTKAIDALRTEAEAPKKSSTGLFSKVFNKLSSSSSSSPSPPSSPLPQTDQIKKPKLDDRTSRVLEGKEKKLSTTDPIPRKELPTSPRGRSASMSSSSLINPKKLPIKKLDDATLTKKEVQSTGEEMKVAPSMGKK